MARRVLHSPPASTLSLLSPLSSSSSSRRHKNELLAPCPPPPLHFLSLSLSHLDLVQQWAKVPGGLGNLCNSLAKRGLFWTTYIFLRNSLFCKILVPTNYTEILYYQNKQAIVLSTINKLYYNTGYSLCHQTFIDNIIQINESV